MISCSAIPRVAERRSAARGQIAVEDGGYESQQIVVSDDKAAQMTPDAINAEREKVVGVWSQVSPILLWQGTFIRPIDPQYATTSPFGTRRDYSVADIGNFHAGQDFGAPEGVLVTAPAAGTVVLAEPITVRGNAVILDHGRGIFTGYWHMSEIKVAGRPAGGGWGCARHRGQHRFEHGRPPALGDARQRRGRRSHAVSGRTGVPVANKNKKTPSFFGETRCLISSCRSEEETILRLRRSACPS